MDANYMSAELQAATGDVDMSDDEVWELLQEIDPDIIQVHNRSDFVPYLLRQFPQKRMVVYMHNQPFFTGIPFDSKSPHSSAARFSMNGCFRLNLAFALLASRLDRANRPKAISRSKMAGEE